jgi:hypothetical protein
VRFRLKNKLLAGKLINMISKFEAWTRRIYQPKEAKWKRPVLFCLSVLIGVGCGVGAYTQIYYGWTNQGVWWVIGLFSFLSILGLLVSLFCKDYWVALVLGKV